MQRKIKKKKTCFSNSVIKCNCTVWLCAWRKSVTHLRNTLHVYHMCMCVCVRVV